MIWKVDLRRDCIKIFLENPEITSIQGEGILTLYKFKYFYNIFIKIVALKPIKFCSV